MRQGLTDAVDLIVMTCIRKSEDLGLQIRKPWRFVWPIHPTTLEFCRLDCHANFLVMFRLDRNDRVPGILQFAHKRRAYSGILDEDCSRLVQSCERNGLRFQGRIIKPATPHVDQIVLVVVKQPGCANRPIVLPAFL